MKLNALRPAADLYDGVVTAYVDVTRTDPRGAHEVELRCRSVADQARDEQADPAVLDALGERLLEPTGLGGTTSRVVVARGQGEGLDVVLDAVLAEEVASHGHHGPIAHLSPLARAVADDVRHAVVLVDHTGAEVTVADTVGATGTDFRSEGDHDVIHKVRGGGWSHRRYQSRVEDSWDRNADQVASDLDRVVVREDPEVVLLAGDDYACSRVAESVSPRTAERLQRLEHGSRAAGASDERLGEEVAAAIQRQRTRRIDDVLERLGAAGEPKAVGVAETVEALRRGEVETLVVLDGALAGREAAVGPEPLHLGHTTEEVRALGVEDPGTDLLEEAMVRAALGQDAQLLPLHAPVGVLPDGVGAVLRFDTRPA